MVALSWVQLATYLFPLATVPYLARVLGTELWGVVAFSQAIGQYAILVIDYGFQLSATREVAQAQGSTERRSEIVAGVLGAKVILALGIISLGFLVSRFLPLVDGHEDVFWAGVAWGVATAFSFVWYFQGLEKMRTVAVLEVGTKGLALIGIFLLVRAPRDAWLALAAMSCAALLSSGLSFFLVKQELPLRIPKLRQIADAFRSGWSLFVFRSAASLYTAANVVILGFFTTASVVGYYAAAEKIVKSALGILMPISGALFPRVSALVTESRQRAAVLVSNAARGVLAGGMVATVALVLGAPLLVELLLGSGYDDVVPIIRVLAWIVPVIGLSNIIGIQWMIPLGFEHVVNRIIVVAGVLNLCMAFVLAPPFQAMGMATAVLISEIFVTAAIYASVRRRRLDPIAVAGLSE